MFRLTRPIICLPLASCLLTAVLSGNAAAQNDVPFKGVIQAVETSLVLVPPDAPEPTLFVDASGLGRATHLGRFDVAYELEVTLDDFFGAGSAHFVAANRDTLFTDVEGEGTVPTADGISFIVETHVITGGTGRFAGATGSFTVERVINVFTGVTSGSMEGSIRFH